MNHYQVLGVPPNASPADIKSAYRKRSREAHPDKGGDHEDMAAINRAYDVLGNPELRKRYDETGLSDRPTPIEAVARSILLDLFAQSAKKRQGKVNHITRTRKALKDGFKEAENKIQYLNDEIGAIQFDIEAVRVTPGTFNAFAAVMEKEIESRREAIRRIEAQTKAGQLALKMLDDYKCDIIDRPPEGGFYAGTISTW